jgi:hypothetical protein
MDSRTKGIVATVAAVVLCGCPGLFFCVFGALTATGNMPFSTELNGVTNTGTLPSTAGFVLLCVSLLLILVPVAVWFFTLRGKPAAKVPDGPMPPAS